MSDRLTAAFNMLRQGGAIFAGRARLTGWSDSPRGMGASFRLDASADALDNPATHPFKGMHVSPKDGDEFMVLVIPVANTTEANTDAGSFNGRTPDFESGNAGSTPAPATTDKRRWTDMPMSQRAALLCSDKLFWQFIERLNRYDTWTMGDQRNADGAAEYVRYMCNVKSRSELDTDTRAAQAFDRLCRDYWQWKNEPVTPQY